MEQKEQSEFNYAVSFLNRLNNWFYLAGLSSFNCEADKWFHALLNVSKEMYDDMSKDDRIKNQDSITVLIPTINSYIVQSQKYNTKQISSETYMLLYDYECFLRIVVKEAGYKTKFKDDPRFAH